MGVMLVGCGTEPQGSNSHIHKRNAPTLTTNNTTMTPTYYFPVNSLNRKTWVGYTIKSQGVTLEIPVPKTWTAETFSRSQYRGQVTRLGRTWAPLWSSSWIIWADIYSHAPNPENPTLKRYSLSMKKALLAGRFLIVIFCRPKIFPGGVMT